MQCNAVKNGLEVLREEFAKERYLIGQRSHGQNRRDGGNAL